MTDEPRDEPALLLIDEIYDALDAGDPEGALALARQARSESSEDDPVVRYLAGVALLELDRPDQAWVELQKAVDLDAEDADARSALGMAYYRVCRFEDSLEHARRAFELDDTNADSAFILGLLAERSGAEAESRQRLETAARLDGERFPLAPAMSDAEFRGHLIAAIERLPELFRGHLEEVAVTVEPFPSDAILTDETPALDPELLGLFVGPTVEERNSTSGPGELPPRILLFQRNLERLALDRQELIEEIAVTLYHELGHYLGMDEDDLERIDLA